MYLVYCVCSDQKEAKKIAKHLLEKKYIACVNIWPMESLCIWEGKLTEAKEYVLLLKTKRKFYPIIEQEIREMHSYDCPAIFGWKTDKCEKNYLQWVQKAGSEGFKDIQLDALRIYSQSFSGMLVLFT